MATVAGKTLAELELRLAQVNVAIEKALKGQSYVIDDVSYSRPNLETLRQMEKDTRADIQDLLDAKRPGGPGPRLREIELV